VDLLAPPQAEGGAIIIDPLATALNPAHSHVVEERDRTEISGASFEDGRATCGGTGDR